MKSSVTSKKLFSGLSAALLGLLSISAARAQTWTGDGDGYSWNNSGNWNGGLPTSTSNLSFGSAADNGVLENANYTIQSITYTSAYTNTNLYGGPSIALEQDKTVSYQVGPTFYGVSYYTGGLTLTLNGS